jgi:hypothetical protein
MDVHSHPSRLADPAVCPGGFWFLVGNGNALTPAFLIRWGQAARLRCLIDCDTRHLAQRPAFAAGHEFKRLTIDLRKSQVYDCFLITSSLKLSHFYTLS